MADQTVTLGMDTRDYTNGIGRALKEADRFGKDFQKTIKAAGGGNLGRVLVGDQVLQRSLKFASEAVKAFAKDNADAQAVLDRWEGIGEKFKAAIGRDLVGAMEGFGDTLSGVMQRLDGFRTEVVDSIVSAATGDPMHASRVDEQRKANEDQARQFAIQQRVDAERMKVAAERARAMGDTAEAARIEERGRYREARQRIGKIADPGERAAMQELEATRHASRMYAIQKDLDEKAAAERKALNERVAKDQADIAERKAKIAQDRAEERARTIEGLSKSFDRNDIDVMAAKGMKEEVELARVRLDYEEQIKAVRDSTVLTAAERQSTVDFLRSQRDEILAGLTGAQVDEARKAVNEAGRGGSFRSLEAGAGGDFFSRGTFAGAGFRVGGPVAAGGPADQLLKAQQRNTAVLEDIRRNTAQTTARAG